MGAAAEVDSNRAEVDSNRADDDGTGADDDGTGAGVDGIVSIFVFMVFVIIIVESDSIWYC
jgi:hypothetical protein